MVSTGNDKSTNEIQEELRGKDDFSLYSSTSQRGLLGEARGKRLHNMLKGFPRFHKFGSSNKLPSTSSKFWRIADEGQMTSTSSTIPPNGASTRLPLAPYIRKINWASLWEMSKQWIRDPLNMALFVWIICVAISGAILFMVMTGMLNHSLPKKSQRDAWFEVNNQIINALFTLMCLYQHPKRFYHLVLLCRWRPNDILRLREIYCKNGTQKPNERKHMMVVVVLLHVNCFAQYALCGLNIGYPRSRRPAIGVGLCVSVAIAAPAIASVYNILSPLGKEYEIETDQEAQSSISTEDCRTPVSNPEWIGGLFDLWDNISLAYMSVFCSCCVFGWNMERLGFGNMYVHIMTFMLFCLAPFFIFNLAAINIDDEVVREALGISGFVLCIFGLLYGGFWRIQMRKKFNLPGNTFCFGKRAVTDCFLWLCCCYCSLVQEVRTADYYDIVDDKLYMKQADDENDQIALSPLPREDGSMRIESGPSFPFLVDNRSSYLRMEHWPSSTVEDVMKPPGTPVIQREK